MTPDGRPCRRTPNGQQTTLFYDPLVRRLAQRTSPAGTVTFTYSEVRPGYFNVGRPTMITSPADVLRLDYDARGQVVQQRRTLDSVVYTVQKAYDGVSGYLRSTTYPDGDMVGPLEYDEAGRLRLIPGIVTNLLYDATGRPTERMNANQTVTTWTYTPERRFLSRIRTTQGATTIQDLGYTPDAVGIVQQVTSPVAGEGWTYGYDDLYRLTTATNTTDPVATQSFQYDAIGRITYNSRVGTYTYPSVGQSRPYAPLTVNGGSLTYDSNGNLTSGQGRTPIWDAENRITQIGGTQFTYDGFGERLKKVSSQGTSLYPFGDDYEVANGQVTKYVSVSGLGVVAKRVGAGTGAQTFWLHADHLGSIQAVTDTTAVAFRRTYRPYGETLGQTGSHTESRGWIDQRNDTETGLTYLHARYFDPKLGTYLSPDPLHPTKPGVGLNRFAYGFGNPVNGADRSGLMYVICNLMNECHFAGYGEYVEVFGGYGGGYGDYRPPRSTPPPADDPRDPTRPGPEPRDPQPQDPKDPKDPDGGDCEGVEGQPACEILPVDPPGEAVKPPDGPPDAGQTHLFYPGAPSCGTFWGHYDRNWSLSNQWLHDTGLGAVRTAAEVGVAAYEANPALTLFLTGAGGRVAGQHFLGVASVRGGAHLLVGGFGFYAGMRLGTLAPALKDYLGNCNP